MEVSLGIKAPLLEVFGQQRDENQLDNGHGLFTGVHHTTLKGFRYGQACVPKAELLEDVVSSERFHFFAVGCEQFNGRLQSPLGIGAVKATSIATLRFVERERNRRIGVGCFRRSCARPVVGVHCRRDERV